MKKPSYQYVLPDRVTILSKNERLIGGDAADAPSLVAALPRDVGIT